jgi:hypothetical protein
MEKLDMILFYLTEDKCKLFKLVYHIIILNLFISIEYYSEEFDYCFFDRLWKKKFI